MIEHETIYRYVSLLFYCMLLLAILNIIVHWYPLASVRPQVTKVTIAFGILSIYFNREQVRHHLGNIQKLDRNDPRFKIVTTFAAYLNREWLTPLAQCTREFDRTNPRHERLNQIISHTFLGMLLILAIQSNASLLLPESLKVPITLIALILGAATYYLKRIGSISLSLHKGDSENTHGLSYKGINNAIPYAFYILLILTLLYQLPWLLDDLKTEIMSATILFGAFTFYLNRDKLEDIGEETRQEELAEKRREIEFAEKYPRIDRVWGVRWIGKWMYREGTSIVLLLVLFSAYGSLLIFHNLAHPEFFHDEWWHVSVITSLQNGGGFELWNYLTDDNICEYPTAKIFNFVTYNISNILGDGEWGLRFFTALMGSAIIPLIYISFKNFIGKYAALLTSVMFSFSIIAIFLARFLRPYTLFLFCYLIVFYLCYAILAQTFKKNIRRIFGILILIILFYGIALDSREFAKMLLPVISLYYLLYLSSHYKNIRNLKKIRNITFLAVSMFTCCMLIMEYFNIINLSILPQQIGDFITLDNISNPTTKYYFYLFEYPVKTESLGYIFFGLGVALLLTKSLAKRRSKYSYFLLNTLVPLLTMVYLFERFEDFRYIYFIVPFVYGCMMFGFNWFICSLMNITFKNSIYLKKYLPLVILLIFIIYPIVPGITIGDVTTKAPSEWQDSDGQQYLHRRAVAPEMEKAYNYVNENINAPYAIVVSDPRVKYLELFKSKKVYSFTPNKKFEFYDVATITKLDMTSNSTLSLNEILEQNEKIVFIVPHVHMINESFFTFLCENTTNLASTANISMYNYNNFYHDKQLYWPNIFVYNSSEQRH